MATINLRLVRMANPKIVTAEEVRVAVARLGTEFDFLTSIERSDAAAAGRRKALDRRKSFVVSFKEM